MTEVRFYHLQRRTLDQALPLLLEKALERGMRAVVRVGSEERLETLDRVLWTWDAASFLPHGSQRDGFAAEQPIWLTTGAENPNRASLLVLTDGAEEETPRAQGETPGFEGFTLVCDLFDGNDEEAVAAARGRWRRCKALGHDMTYWQQTATGGWERKM